MSQDEIRRLVQLVGDGLRRRRPEAEIVAMLCSMGIPTDAAPEMLAAIRQAFKAGVLAAITEGHSSPDGPPTDPLLAEAYRQGQENYSGAVRRVWLERAVVAVIGLGIVVAAITWLMGWWGQ